MNTVIAIAAAVALLLWPSKKAATPAELVIPDLSVAPKGVSYQAAMTALAAVRTRLAKTEQLSEEATEAIGVLTMALVSGSDK